MQQSTKTKHQYQNGHSHVLYKYGKLFGENDYFNSLKDIYIYLTKIKLYHFKQSDNHTFAPFEVPINFTGFYDKNFNEVIDDLCDETENIIDYKLR